MDDFTLKNKCTILCSKRNSGKSIMCRYLVKKQQSLFDDIFVISMTEDVNGFYKTFINEKNIYSEFNIEWIESLYSRIEAMVKKGEKKHILLIFDDCGVEPDFYKNPTIKKIFCRGRHIFLSTIILQQYLYQLSPVCRSNCDYILCGQMNKASIDILSEEFLFGSIDKKTFIKLYTKASSNHGFFVINNNSVEDAEVIDSIYGKITVPQDEAH